jgi:hypothetical protein
VSILVVMEKAGSEMAFANFGFSRVSLRYIELHMLKKQKAKSNSKIEL